MPPGICPKKIEAKERAIKIGAYIKHMVNMFEFSIMNEPQNDDDRR